MNELSAVQASGNKQMLDFDVPKLPSGQTVVLPARLALPALRRHHEPLVDRMRHCPRTSAANGVDGMA